MKFEGWRNLPGQYLGHREYQLASRGLGSASRLRSHPQRNRRIERFAEPTRKESLKLAELTDPKQVCAPLATMHEAQRRCR